MRIRKRFHPSSLSSTAAVLSVSDPQLNRSPVLQPHIRPNSHENLFVVVQEDAKTNHPKTTSDPPNPNQPFQQHSTSQEMMIGSANPRWDFLSIHKGEEMNEKQEKVKDDGWKEEQAGKKSSNDTRKESSTGEEMNSGTQLSPQPSSSASAPASTVIERWCEGDKVVPLKKRKGSFESIIVASKESTNSVKEKMKSKTNKKCLVQNGCDHGQEGIKETSSEEVKVNNNNNGKNTMSRVKKSKRGSVIMEGSRCSRVNGRGWRCCQQTLVGYSLCEHHLGKGRLRSMSSVRNRGGGGGGGGTAGNHQIGAREKDDQIAPLSTLPEKQEMINDDDIIDDKKPLMVVTKKRMKLGVVKARSMSSLLGQTNNTALAANGNKHSG